MLINGKFSLISTTSSIISDGKRATRSCLSIAGFGLACWAPLVPFARQRLAVSEAELGTILLFLGLGAVLGMPAAGAMSSRLGSRPVIVAGALGIALSLPLMAVLTQASLLATALFLFGASIGAVDVAANIHGTDVQDAAQKPMMSGFHGIYSVAGLVGSFGMTALIASGLSPATASIICSMIVVICITFAFNGFFTALSKHDHPLLAIPKGVVILIGVAAMVISLAEGAMLDWGALLLTEAKGAGVELAGFGYVAFAFAMTISRLIGDRLVVHLGEKKHALLGYRFHGYWHESCIGI